MRQVVQPVLWEQTMRGLLAQGVDQFYEIGPGRVLAGCSSGSSAKRAELTVDMAGDWRLFPY